MGGLEISTACTPIEEGEGTGKGCEWRSCGWQDAQVEEGIDSQLGWSAIDTSSMSSSALSIHFYRWPFLESASSLGRIPDLVGDSTRV